MTTNEDRHVVILTGAAKGIVAAIADTLLTSPMTRLKLVDINEEPLKAKKHTVGAERLQHVIGNVAETETNERTVSKTIDTWGRIDALALNASVMAAVQGLDGSKDDEQLL